jgi:hypothetical protein
MQSQPGAATRRNPRKASRGQAPARGPEHDAGRGQTDALVDELAVSSVEVPEDVRAELDADQRRVKPAPLPSTPAVEVPEDVLSELDREARLGHAEALQRLAEGEPPAEEDRLEP